MQPKWALRALQRTSLTASKDIFTYFPILSSCLTIRPSLTIALFLLTRFSLRSFKQIFFYSLFYFIKLELSLENIETLKNIPLLY